MLFLLQCSRVKATITAVVFRRFNAQLCLCVMPLQVLLQETSRLLCISCSAQKKTEVKQSELRSSNYISVV